MKEADVVIIGGSAAGPVAGVTVRRHYKNASILLVRQENKVMVPCGIPYIFGTVGSPDKNVIPDALLSNNGIELMVDEVTSVDRASKILTTKGGEVVGYEKLILAIGSVPVRPPIPGMDLQNVFPMWKDADFLGQAQEILGRAKEIVIIGGGFIGAEMADECKKIGDVNVTIVELLPHCLMLAMDEEFCCMAESRLEERGIKIITDDGVRSILGDGKVSAVELRSGDKIKADVVIVGIGAVPNTHPGSMPGAKEVKTKLLFDKETGKIIGGELSGGITTGEMANIIAALIQSEMTADEVATFQMGTQPCLTASPIVYQIVNAAEQALTKLR